MRAGVVVTAQPGVEDLAVLAEELLIQPVVDPPTEMAQLAELLT